jgi:hypothetical protein
MLKILVKLWPIIIPIAVYILWQLAKKRQKNKDGVIEGEFEIVEKKKTGMFSLENNAFVAVLYITFVIAIFGMIFIVAL